MAEDTLAKRHQSLVSFPSEQRMYTIILDAARAINVFIWAGQGSFGHGSKEQPRRQAVGLSLVLARMAMNPWQRGRPATQKVRSLGGQHHLGGSATCSGDVGKISYSYLDWQRTPTMSAMLHCTPFAASEWKLMMNLGLQWL